MIFSPPLSHRRRPDLRSSSGHVGPVVARRRRPERPQDGNQSYCTLTLIIFSEELDYGTRLQHVVGIG
jgi:hypothetical protein